MRNWIFDLKMCTFNTLMSSLKFEMGFSKKVSLIGRQGQGSKQRAAASEVFENSAQNYISIGSRDFSSDVMEKHLPKYLYSLYRSPPLHSTRPNRQTQYNWN